MEAHDPSANSGTYSGAVASSQAGKMRLVPLHQSAHFGKLSISTTIVARSQENIPNYLADPTPTQIVLKPNPIVLPPPVQSHSLHLLNNKPHYPMKLAYTPGEPRQMSSVHRQTSPLIPAEPPKPRVGKWADYEDAALKDAIGLLGTLDWNMVAGMVHGRTANQCRERWVSFLAHGLNNGDLSTEEVRMMKKLLPTYAQSRKKPWAKLAQQFPGRTGSILKNAWKRYENSMKPKRSVSKSQLASAANGVDEDDETFVSGVIWQEVHASPSGGGHLTSPVPSAAAGAAVTTPYTPGYASSMSSSQTTPATPATSSSSLASSSSTILHTSHSYELSPLEPASGASASPTSESLRQTLRSAPKSNLNAKPLLLAKPVFKSESSNNGTSAPIQSNAVLTRSLPAHTTVKMELSEESETEPTATQAPLQLQDPAPTQDMMPLTAETNFSQHYHSVQYAPDAQSASSSTSGAPHLQTHTRLLPVSSQPEHLNFTQNTPLKSRPSQSGAAQARQGQQSTFTTPRPKFASPAPFTPLSKHHNINSLRSPLRTPARGILDNSTLQTSSPAPNHQRGPLGLFSPGGWSKMDHSIFSDTHGCIVDASTHRMSSIGDYSTHGFALFGGGVDLHCSDALVDSHEHVEVPSESGSGINWSFSEPSPWRF